MDLREPHEKNIPQEDYPRVEACRLSLHFASAARPANQGRRRE